MPARTPGKKSVSRKPAPARAADKRIAGKKKADKERPSPGIFSKAKHMVEAVLMGAATGAVTGAVKGAVEAGSKEARIRTESKKVDRSQKGIAGKPSTKEPKKRRRPVGSWC